MLVISGAIEASAQLLHGRPLVELSDHLIRGQDVGFYQRLEPVGIAIRWMR